MLQSLLFLVLGMVGLYFGAEWLVRGAARFAANLRVSPLFIGLTIVSFGTSAPEMVICVVAALQKNSDVALGNVLGSNVANVGLILALTAVVAPLPVAMRLVRRELPFMLGATLVLYALASRLSIGRLEGALFFAALILFSWLALRWARAEPPPVVAEYERYEEAAGLRRPVRILRDLGLLGLGLSLLLTGGHLLVTAAVDLAQRAGISDLIVAATVVAVGSSLPELATSIVAAVRGEADIVVGNIVGSNVFNILGALGLSAMVQPVRIGASLVGLEFAAFLLFSLALGLVLRTGHTVSRREGVILLVAYAVFVTRLYMG